MSGNFEAGTKRVGEDAWLRHDVWFRGSIGYRILLIAENVCSGTFYVFKFIIFCYSLCRVGNFRQTNSPEDKIDETNGFVLKEFQLFRRTENSRNSVPNHSVEKKNAGNSVSWTKNISKLAGFRSELLRGRENNLNFVPRTKIKTTLWGILFLSISRKKHSLNSVCWNRKL